MSRHTPIKSHYWYLVDFYDPTNPIADRKGHIKHYAMEATWEYALNKDPRVIIVKGSELIEYGIVLKKHFAYMGKTISVRTGLPIDVRKKIMSLKRWPWPDYPHINWFNRLRRMYPKEKIQYQMDPKKDKIRNKEAYNMALIRYYKNLYKMYSKSHTI